MLTANRAAPDRSIAPEMVAVLTPDALFKASFYTEISAREIHPLPSPALLQNISPSPFGVQLLICDELTEFKSSVYATK